nr:hypothetical protein B0A51_17461 [Rachicladosporium sp. CCFEE 5018]
MTMSTSLPDAASPEISLVVATPKENLAQTHANSVEWRGALSLDAYFKREALLLTQDLTRDNGLTAWMLVHTPPGSSERRVLCGCESIRKRALVKPGKGEVIEVVAHGVASVFCEESRRGRGYAGRMMELLGERLEGWGKGEGQKVAFSALWSDIGKNFYAARGWKAMPSSHIALPAESSARLTGLPETTPLKATDLAPLCDADETLLRTRLAALDTPKTTVTLLPDLRTFDWHHAREDFIAKELHSRNPTIKGAIVGTEEGKRAWCIWTKVWTNPSEKADDTLHILRLVVEDAAYDSFAAAGSSTSQSQMNGHAGKDNVVQQISALLVAAQREAKDWHMQHVELWNPTALALEAANAVIPETKVVAREKESICSLRWYGEGSGEDVDWVCSEKFGWC